MGRLSMGVYKYCDDDLYISLRARLDAFENEIAMLVANDEFSVNRHREWGELCIDLNYRKSSLGGNIGFCFIDEPNPVPMFYFFVLKALDVDKKRYFLRTNLFDSISLDALESGFVEHWKAALALWNGWDVSDLLNGEYVALKQA